MPGLLCPMTCKHLFARIIEIKEDRLCFLSCTKYGRTKEDCPPLFLSKELIWGSRLPRLRRMEGYTDKIQVC